MTVYGTLGLYGPRGPGDLHPYSGKIDSQAQLILLVGFIDVICALAQSPIDDQIPKRHGGDTPQDVLTH